MGRRPSVFVRPVTMDEGRKLQRIGRTAAQKGCAYNDERQRPIHALDKDQDNEVCLTGVRNRRRERPPG
ncbi:hypothetical protein ACWDA7_36690 [Streptomyces sp. NPDC001156]